jgi:hypothetical protein
MFGRYSGSRLMFITRLIMCHVIKFTLIDQTLNIRLTRRVTLYYCEVAFCYRLTNAVTLVLVPK